MNGRERHLSSPDATPASGVGHLAARYRSLFEIGRGGMATIEVALERSAGGFERIVALKRLHPYSARERRQTEAFVREARLAVWLVHPNVVHAFDFGEIDGELFLAMEYVEGETLSAILRFARERTGGAAAGDRGVDPRRRLRRAPRGARAPRSDDGHAAERDPP